MMRGQTALQSRELDRAEPRSTGRRTAVATKIEIAVLTQAVARGVENLTVEEIALAAGVSRRTFYRYFATVEDALCALARRSVARLSEGLAARPHSENIFQALAAIRSNETLPPEEIKIQELANKAARRSPTAWWQAINKAEVGASSGMEPVIAQRLAATGDDVSLAPMITAVYLGIAGVIGRGDQHSGKFGLDPDRMEDALRKITDYMHAAFADKPASQSAAP